MGCWQSHTAHAEVVDVDQTHTGPATLELHAATDSIVGPPSPDAAADAKEEEEQVVLQGITKFNVTPKKGVAYLVQAGVVTDSPESVATFLRQTRSFAGRRGTATGLNKARVGEYLGMLGKSETERAFHARLLQCYLDSFDFVGESLDSALRHWLAAFRLPGEGQMIDRMMNAFSCRYCAQNPSVFAHPDVAYVLAYSLIMLNTSLHNPNARNTSAMTFEAFCKNLRGINEGADLPQSLLETLYNSIAMNRLEMEAETSVVTFFNPVHEGWLGKLSTGKLGRWKLRYFLVNDSCLYYFRRKDEIERASPRCIIPLEHMVVVPIGARKLELRNTDNTVIKSVKRLTSGQLQQGSHLSLQLRAESSDDRDDWLRALEQEIQQPMKRNVQYKKFWLRHGGSKAELLTRPARQSSRTSEGSPLSRPYSHTEVAIDSIHLAADYDSSDSDDDDMDAHGMAPGMHSRADLLGRGETKDDSRTASPRPRSNRNRSVSTDVLLTTPGRKSHRLGADGSPVVQTPLSPATPESQVPLRRSIPEASPDALVVVAHAPTGSFDSMSSPFRVEDPDHILLASASPEATPEDEQHDAATSPTHNVREPMLSPVL